MDILDTLNDEQKNALLETDGAVLVTAGAGTGKTKLLTHRIAYLIETKKVDPYNILAITFTNKAANEMKSRVEAIVSGGNRVWISTFHSMCAKMLRQDIEKLGDFYNRYFTIYSDQDTEKLLKQILKDFGLEDDIKKYEFHISNCKNKNMTITQYQVQVLKDKDAKTIVDVFEEYEKRLKENNALDFDNLLTKTYELLVKNPDVLEYYSKRFEYVLVDEFQDTNKIQYDLVKLLCSNYRNIFVVGDEDQSIYSWRGADFTNIFNISKDFPSTKVFKLQQNYRCTKPILDIANKLIAINSERFDKKLWTDKNNGDEVDYKKYYDEREEAEGVASKIYYLVNNLGYNYKDIAVLVRINALTMPFEEKLLTYNIPHKIYGGFRFFERAEIKNILSYLRMFINERDEVSLFRIINFPRRGVGDSAISLIKKTAEQYNVSSLSVILNIDKYSETSSIKNKLKNFKDTFLELKELKNTLPLDEFIDEVIERYKIKDAYPEDNEESVDKLMNISQLIGSIKNFIETNVDADLNQYLESVTLQSDIDTLNDDDNVVIATIHAVKGLEFKVVFVVGLEDGIFPLSRCKDDDRDLQEERRLAYVGFTRAKEKLFLSSCRSRFMYGRRNYERESQFLTESGVVELKEKMPRLFNDVFKNAKYYENSYEDDGENAYLTKSQQPYKNIFIPKPNCGNTYNNAMGSNTNTKNYKVGQIVGHPKFGVGSIVSISADNKMADIDFTGIGKKTLMLDIAPLKIIK